MMIYSTEKPWQLFTPAERKLNCYLRWRIRLLPQFRACAYLATIWQDWEVTGRAGFTQVCYPNAATAHIWSMLADYL